jgi:hypothetical protein
MMVCARPPNPRLQRTALSAAAEAEQSWADWQRSASSRALMGGIPQTDTEGRMPAVRLAGSA